jgi:hypothetical protein
VIWTNALARMLRSTRTPIGGASHSACRVERVPDPALSTTCFVCHNRDALEPCRVS